MGLDRGLNVLVPIFYRNIGEGEECQLSSLVLHGLIGGRGQVVNPGQYDRVESWVVSKKLWLVPGAVSSEEGPRGALSRLILIFP